MARWAMWKPPCLVWLKLLPSFCAAQLVADWRLCQRERLREFLCFDLQPGFSCAIWRPGESLATGGSLGFVSSTTALDDVRYTGWWTASYLVDGKS